MPSMIIWVVISFIVGFVTSLITLAFANSHKMSLTILAAGLLAITAIGYFVEIVSPIGGIIGLFFGLVVGLLIHADLNK